MNCMIDIRVNNESLDLPEGLIITLERINPFLQFSKDINGSYTFPFTVKNTDTNARLLNYAGVYQKKINGEGVDAVVYDDGIPIFKGKLKIERPLHDLNYSSRTTISCYIVTDVADFWQEIKDVKLRQVAVGGDRSWPWDGLSTLPASPGFWRHIHVVANAAPNSYDYAFYPVINKGWASGTEFPEIMNMMYWDVAEAPLEVRFPTVYVGLASREANRIVPFPYLHYVLQKCFDHIGWKLSGDILTDPDFLKITMLNFRAIDWASPGSGPNSYYAKNPVVFNLQDHLPDITLSSFLIALKNRFGWWYDFDVVGKTCTINGVVDLTTQTPVDFTEYAAPLIEKSALTNERKFALKTTDGQGGGSIDFSLIDYKGAINTLALLPAASNTIYGWVYFVSQDNNYWICERTDADVYEWQRFAYNLYDYVPAGATDDISTDAGTVGMEAYDSYFTLLPRMDNQGQWFGRSDDEAAAWGVHLLFFHGRKNKSSISSEQYPYACNHIYDPSMNQIGEWALTYNFIKIGGTDVGLYKTFWEAFLLMLQSSEEHSLTLNLPLYVMKNIDFKKPGLVKGVRHFIYSYQPALPYNNRVEVKVWRV